MHTNKVHFWETVLGMYGVGILLYEDEIGVEEDVNKAKEWYQSARSELNKLNAPPDIKL